MSETIPKSRLYREAFLPGAANRMRNRVIVKVTGVRNDDLSLDQIDRSQLHDIADAYLRSWEHAGGAIDPGLEDALARRTIVIQSPSEIYVNPFPLLLQCDKCEVLDFYGESNEEKQRQKIARRITRRGGRPCIACPRSGCTGTMHQVPYVVVHRCGSASSMGIRRSLVGTRHIGFKDTGGSFFYNYYVDVDTGTRLTDDALQANCPTCAKTYPGRSKMNQRATPVPSGESFYPQTVQYIALSRASGELVSRLQAVITSPALEGMAIDIAEGITSVLLGIANSKTVSNDLAALFNRTEGKIDVAAVEQEIAKLKSKIEALEAIGDMDEVIKLVRAQLHMQQSKLGNHSGQFSGVRGLLDDDSTLVAIARDRRSIEAAFLRHDVSMRSIDEHIAQSDISVRQELDTMWGTVKSRYGISEVSHISDLKVVLAAVGFSRERRAPDHDDDAPPVVLNGFEDACDPGMRGRRALHAMSAETEAIWIRLDSRKLLTWCVKAAQWDAPPQTVMDDEAKAHAWLLRYSDALTMHPGHVNNGTRGLPPKSSAPFHLLHSIAHGLLATIRQHSGYDEKSIMEYLLPSDLSFILYVTSVQNYTAGGLVTLFENYLLNWFDDAAKFTFNCAFDPFCTEQGGACSGCLQRELACETMNVGLSRNFIHGGTIDALAITQPFWD
jgi:hypothetical protein